MGWFLRRAFGRPCDWLKDLDVGDTIMWEHSGYPDVLEPRIIEDKKTGPHGAYWKISKRSKWVGEAEMSRRGHPVE